MSENVMKTPEFEEAELLLPWYSTGTLSDAEMQIVDAWLAEHPEANDRLANVREEMHLTIEGNEAIKAPGVAGLNRLMADIAAEGDARVQSAGFFERIGAFLTSLSPQAMGMATAACLGLLVVQAAVIGSFVGGNDGGTVLNPYEVATGEPVPTGPMALVQFQDTATVIAISDLLSKNQATIISGPKPGAQYKVVFAEDADLDAMIANLLQQSDVVKSALRGGK